MERVLSPQDDHYQKGREARAKVPGGVQQCQIGVMTLDLEIGGIRLEKPLIHSKIVS